MHLIFTIIDWGLFTFFAIGVIYLLTYSLASLFPPRKIPLSSDKKAKIAVVFPVYREGEIIIESISSFNTQDYPKDMYDVIVVADHLDKEFINVLKIFPITTLDVHFESSSKAQALQHSVKNIKKEYDILVILDADNEVDNTFLSDINNAFQNGYKYIQCHRVAKNKNSHVAVLDAVSEEINNSIFRKGHNNLNIAAALIGSGMAFEYKWIEKAINTLSTVGEDKELELLLHIENKYIKYLDNTTVYDYKTRKAKSFHKQRRRWQAAQVVILARSIKQVVSNVSALNFDFFDKIYQWLMPSRVLFLLYLIIISVIAPFIEISIAYKWLALLGLCISALLLAIPKYLYNKRLLKAFIYIPLLAFLMFQNIFHLKKGKKEFIHTEHS